MRPILMMSAVALFMILSESHSANSETKTDATVAILAFEQACLASAPQYGDWKAVFRAANVNSLNRNKFGMPRSFPAGDAIVDPKVVARNIGAPIVADCSVVIKGNASAAAAKSVSAFLSSPDFPLSKRSDMFYTAQSKAEKVVFQKAFRSNGRNFHVLVMTKVTPEFGLLTSLNASLVDDTK